MFETGDGHKTVGTVTSAAVNEPEKQVYFAISDAQGNAQIRREPMSDAALVDYRANPEAYFGRIVRVGRTIEDRYSHFEFHMEANKGLPRATLLERMAKAPNLEELKNLSDADLLAVYCESMVSFEASGFKTPDGKR